MGMTDSKKAQAVGALRKCAKEHEKDFTPTFNIRVSDLCSDVADYLEDLKKENEELEEIRGQQARIINNDTDRIEKLKKEITDLKAQIEKMKCCQMCKHLQDGGSCLKADKNEVKKWGNFLIKTRRKNHCKNWEPVE